MEVLQPKQRAGDQETLHLAAAEIVDEGIPIVMESLAWIDMLVKRRAVEARKPVRIGRKVRRHPIENDADAGGVQRFDEMLETSRRSIAGARCK